MDDIKCSACGKVFSTRSNLSRHQKNSKCDRAEQKCSNCDYTTFSSRGIKIHESRCKYKEKCEKEVNNLKKTIEDLNLENNALKEAIIDLKIQLAEKKGMLAVKTAPKTVNYVNQKLLTIQCATIEPLTVDTVKRSIDAGNYTFQHFKLGADGIVDFISDIICTEDGQRNYACSDISRNKCHRLIETREWQADNGATFINKILDQLREPTIGYNKKVIKMWTDEGERDSGDELREKTREMVIGITEPKSSERKELFTRVRAGVKKLAAV